MLDTDTKRNIDAARNVLVGKVPDPKAQVEQITTALIYKFMDDLDTESVELGGKATFFVREYEKYSWTKVIDTRLTGEGRLDLYVQAITNMSRNPNLPQLFRDIFKGAFLPYNDPQTLSLFLKEINKFSYDHSEELGNAFEYLLSVLGSQGDAGQFRTPRHIIDFIVEVVDPQKTDTILDPACGTAGFLISAYKHIRKHNSSNFNPEEDMHAAIGDTAAELIMTEKEVYTGDNLTPTERKKLTQNIQGYDISPDMVRLSLVNLYLHGFTNPHIYEYDTLTSEKRWGETFNVILANPPFMTPKGGIRPHKRFQVQARRSEVLFVDYILEHLNINGRAGIIVPEGIIFKTETAYKKLRKLLLEDGLYAVVSLPSGVFNPYSGVKTCILFFDNQFAKKTEEILFITVENDGFGLGSQRRKIGKDDLPNALKILGDWKKGNKRESNLALWVKKEKISDDGDYILSRNRYMEIEVFGNKKWPTVNLREVAEIISGQSPKSEFYNDIGEGTPFYQGKTLFGAVYLNEPTKWTTNVTRIAKTGDILMSVRAPVGPVNICPQEICIGRGLAAIRPTGIKQKYLFYILRAMKGKIKGSGGAVFDSINKTQISQIQLPLPPLEVQQEIVAQIEVKQAVIDGAKTVIENLEKERRYFGHELRKMEGVESVELGEVCEFKRGPFGGSLKKEIFVPSGYKVYEQKNAIKDNFEIGTYYVTPGKFEEMQKFELKPGDMIISCSGTMGRIAIAPENIEPGIINQALLRLTPNKELTSAKYLRLILESEPIQKRYFRDTSGAAIQNVASVKVLKKIQIPFPGIEVQSQLVAEAEEEEKIFADNQHLIELMKKKIEKVLEEI